MKRPDHPVRRRSAALILLAFIASLSPPPRGARAQGAFVFDERLYNTPETCLNFNPTFSGGSVTWTASILGADLWVVNDQFKRYHKSANSNQAATLTTTDFPPFTSDSWVYRVSFNGTSSTLNGPSNYVLLQVDGDGGSYGCRLLVNRTDGNGDLIMGTGVAFNDLFNQDVFTANTLVNHPLRLTLVNRQSKLYAFVDDLMPSVAPINMMFSTAGAGTIGAATWNSASLWLGARYTGTADDVQLYNVMPYIESFNTTATVNAAPTPTLLDNTWTVLDANTPTPWRINGQLLEWQGTGNSNPLISSSSPQTDFVSDSWQFHATLKFLSAVNLANNRILFEIVPASGPALGVIVPHASDAGRRLLVYSGTASNIVASSYDGSTLVASASSTVLYRLSMEYNRGELHIRINDRELTVGAADLGFGSQNWKGFRIGGTRSYGFAVDDILFHDAGEGWLGAPPDWAGYD